MLSSALSLGFDCIRKSGGHTTKGNVQNRGKCEGWQTVSRREVYQTDNTNPTSNFHDLLFQEPSHPQLNHSDFVHTVHVVFYVTRFSDLHPADCFRNCEIFCAQQGWRLVPCETLKSADGRRFDISGPGTAQGRNLNLARFRDNFSFADLKSRQLPSLLRW